MNRYIAFGRTPRIPGEYEKRPTIDECVAEFTKNGGEGFWSLVRGEHRVLVCMEVIRRTVSNLDHRPRWSRFREPMIGEEVLVVIPEEPFTEWMDEDVNNIDRTQPLPIPACSLEIWKRRK